MKTLIFTLLIVTLFSCQDQKLKQEKALDLRINQELSSNVKNDTIFLGICFGMTKKQLDSYMNNLVKNKKLHINESNYFEYKFDFGNNPTFLDNKATFSADYFKNKLYELKISIKADNPNASPTLILLKLVNIFASKYGYTYLKREAMFEDCDDYIWVNGNRMIELKRGLNDAKIIYTDIPIDREKRKFEIENIKQKTKSIKNDI